MTIRQQPLTAMTLFFMTLFPAVFSLEDESVKAINAHIRIRDYNSAISEAVDALHQYPHSKPLWQTYIKALGKAGNEREMLSTWKGYTDVFPEEKENREITETLSWAVINNASNSSSPIVRLMALLSGYFSQDSRGVEILLKSLQDKNSGVRGLAVKLSADLRDDAIKDAVYKMFKQETVWKVRLGAIQALGHMKMRSVQPELMELLQNSKISAEETVAIVQALVHLMDSAARSDIIKLANSSRAGLRLLACQVIAHFDMKNEVDLIAHLCDDHNALVRKEALWLIGYLRIDELKGKRVADIAAEKINDLDADVGLKAAWLMTLHDQQRGQKAFERWLNHPTRDVQIAAAAHLSACGKYGMPLAINHFNKSTDPIVRMNLALGMIGQRMQTENACRSLYDGINRTSERLAFDEDNHVRSLVPSKVRYSDDLDKSPEAVDQVTRLEILNILAMMKFPHAQKAIKQFLKEKNWGITTIAAATLLTEGEEEAIAIVEKLLEDADMQVRVQAALILALWGGGDRALETLSKAYGEVDREMKEHILEGIVRIASPKSIPFLLERLQEQNQSMRVIAAAGLILCLYH
jgi:HEAT repeat protein